MSARWGGWRRERVPDDVRAALASVDRVLAWALDDLSGARIVAGRHRLHVLPPEISARLETPEQVPGRSWHLVDSGVWDPSISVLTVTWVDHSPVVRVRLTEPNGLPETLRERVQASVILSEDVDLGRDRSARVVIRRDLASGELLSQTLLGPGVTARDPGTLVQTEQALARLREQVGL